MPLVFSHQSLKFFFYSNEGNPREPVHVHVRSAGASAKVWLHPTIGIAESRGFNSKELSAILRLVMENRQIIEKTWHDYFGN
ncbi:DUF4160 domain-containing protein [Shinella sp. AETb1-6]|jgi:hypothetical protein|uniref:DUF4160 domain-containing protein n=1 Tax=Shinella sp. AETb1-6 TaxID=2692210 RepID=UPI00136FD083|nr:DUF4160 domain-containing protein [Shinella sp. AETb1-6]MXN50019.1 DUF4160 domain-containing protein [Shinella sp. AETb1-6]